MNHQPNPQQIHKVIETSERIQALVNEMFDAVVDAEDWVLDTYYGDMAKAANALHQRAMGLASASVEGSPA